MQLEIGLNNIMKKINKMPKSCQENWLELSPNEKVIFCNLCQKNIFDQTTEGSESDEIVCMRYATSKNHVNKKFSDKLKQFLFSRIKKNRAN